MSNGQAPQGGAIGTNGEFYAGGQFLPSTQLPKRHQPKPTYTGPRREQVAPYEWSERPEGMRSIFAAIVGVQAEYRNGRLARFEPGCAYYGETIRRMGDTLGTVDTLIAKWNAGERWINVAA